MSAKTRISCVTPFVLLVKKSVRKIPAKSSKSTRKNVARFLQSELTPNFFCHAVVCSEVLDTAANEAPSKIIKSKAFLEKQSMLQNV